MGIKARSHSVNELEGRLCNPRLLSKVSNLDYNALIPQTKKMNERNGASSN